LVHRWVFGGIIAIAVLLFALIYARVVKQRNISLQQKVEAQERLRLFIEHAPTALAMFDRDMCYIAVSRRWLSDYGLGERDLRGQSHYDIFPEIGEAWKEAHRRGQARFCAPRATASSGPMVRCNGCVGK
jgi:PAS domain-containing protein